MRTEQENLRWNRPETTTQTHPPSEKVEVIRIRTGNSRNYTLVEPKQICRGEKCTGCSYAPNAERHASTPRCTDHHDTSHNAGSVERS